jgi:hypothetical protein
MLFDGKRVGEMSAEELDAADAYCTRMMRDANTVFDLNRVGLIEVCEERTRRLLGENPSLDPYIKRALDS